MKAAVDQLKQAMTFTTRYPELGTGPVDVRPLIDPELFELEREKIFKQVWLYIARADHKGTFPSLAKLEHTDIRCFGPHSTSGIYVPPVPGLEPTPVTANLGGRLITSKRHGPHMELLPANINRDKRGDFQFEFPVFFPNFLLHLGAAHRTAAFGAALGCRPGRLPALLRGDVAGAGPGAGLP